MSFLKKNPSLFLNTAAFLKTLLQLKSLSVNLFLLLENYLKTRSERALRFLFSFAYIFLTAVWILSLSNPLKKPAEMLHI